jgi:rRNA maturation endonuclease Nob1
MKTEIKKQNVPTANICVNKSRVKIYDKETDPKIYLSKQTEFQVELFNPTTETVLAKITLNGNVISQGGLVLNPGQRVFLDRYLDVAKKFLFDTYEVANTQEVKEAIVNNGDFKVEFYRELKQRPRTPILKINNLNKNTIFGGPNYDQGIFRYDSTNTGGYVHNSTTNNTSISTFTTNGLLSSNIPTNAFYSSSVDNSVTMDWMQTEKSVEIPKDLTRSKGLKAKKSKSIETGRVEEGSKSDQKFKTVNKDFEYFAFHTVEYKLLPVSQKINTSEDLNVRRYCTNCGAKLHKDHKFCGHCGSKA